MGRKIIHILSGWWFQSLWKMMEFVSWDDELPNIWKNKINVPNHQPVSMENHHGNHRSSTSIFLGNNVQDAMLNSQRVHLHLCIWLKRNNSPSWKVKRHVGIVAPILNEVVNFFINLSKCRVPNTYIILISMYMYDVYIYIYTHIYICTPRNVHPLKSS